MFVRFKKRRNKNLNLGYGGDGKLPNNRWPNPDGSFKWIISLIENQRVKGRVTQKHIMVLGTVDGWSLDEYFIGIKPATVASMKTYIHESGDDWRMLSIKDRFWFWYHADKRLALLAGEGTIDAADRPRFEDVIAARVPRPTEDERANLITAVTATSIYGPACRSGYVKVNSARTTANGRNPRVNMRCGT